MSDDSENAGKEDKKEGKKVKIKELPPKIKEVKKIHEGEKNSHLEEEIVEAEEEKFETFITEAGQAAPPVLNEARSAPRTETPRIREVREERVRENPYENRQLLYGTTQEARRDYNLSTPRLPEERIAQESPSLRPRPVSMLAQPQFISPEEQRVELFFPERREDYQTEFEKQKTRKRYPWEV